MNNQVNAIINNIWQTEYLGNTVFKYAVFLALFFVLFVLFFFFKRYLLKKARCYTEEGGVGELFINLLSKVRPSFYVYISFYLAHFTLEVPSLLTQALTTIFIIWLAYRVVVSGEQVIDFATEKYMKREEENGDKTSAARALGKLGKILLWVFALLVVLSTFGINITALVAGLGVGGVAIAFALQNILSDLFSSFSIYFDKPFVEGDFIIVGDKMGTVEKIGIKSTRVRALQGEEIVFSNQELTSVQVHNFKKMEQRRADLKLGVVYDTPSEILERIPGIIKEIIEKQDLAQFDRAHFSGFGDFSLDFLVVYYVKSADYNVFMDTQEKVLLEIKREFDKENIEFAYPTKTIYLAKQEQ